jgi:phosphoribosylglycinamide formyltransferase-1
MRSIVEARTGLEVKSVISNRPEAPGLEWARARSLATQVVDHREYGSREAFDAALAAAIERQAPDYVVLAGFMRIFTQGFVERFRNRIVNIHPSLLPAFTGLHTHRRALAEGVKLHGATVHFVTPELDHGPVIIQGAVPVLGDDTEETLAARVLAVEHRIYPQAVRWLVEDRVRMDDAGRVHVQGAGTAADYLVAPREPA